MRSVNPLLLSLLACLAACGGGGGPSGGEFTLSADTVAFSALQDGARPAPVAIQMTVTGAKAAYAGLAYRNGQAMPTWLDLTMDGQGTTFQVKVSIVSTALTPGTYTSTFAVGTADANGDVLADRDVTVTLDIGQRAPSLVLQQASVLLGGAAGLDTDAQPLSFGLASATDTCFYTATASTASGGDWLRLSATSGTVGPARADLQVQAERAGLAPGRYTGEIRVDCTARGFPLTRTIPVTLNLEASRLLVGATGVGFSAAPGRSVLTRDVPVHSAEGRTGVVWVASADQPWLTATASGVVGEPLRLTADPAGLAADTTHFATVRVTSPDPAVENEETIRVGLAVRSADPADVSLFFEPAPPVASPVEPVVFVGGATGVTAYDVYSGAVARQLPVAGPVASLTVSGDGTRLYYYAAATGEVVELDAAGGAELRRFDATVPGTGAKPLGGEVSLVRPGGEDVLITPSTRMYRLANGAELPDRFEDLATSTRLTASLDGTAVVATYGAYYRMRRAALDDRLIFDEYAFGLKTDSVGAGQACVSADGATVYVAKGSPYDFRVHDVASGKSAGSLPGAAYPNSVECLWNGLMVGGISNYYGTPDVWVYAGRAPTPLATFSSAQRTSYRQLLRAGLAASADGTRLATATSGPYATSAGMRLQSLPTPP